MLNCPPYTLLYYIIESEESLTDTHSHIYGSEFADDVEQVIARARAVGVERILLPNINAESIEPMLALCRQHPGYLFPMMGLHPTDLTPDYRQVLDQMERLLAEPGHPYVAVGEVGLDYYWDKSLYAEQQLAFRRQVEWAVAYRLPLMIHSRAAHRELVDILNEYRGCGLTGVFHCFGGSLDEARELLSFEGFVLGIGGVATYKKSTLPQVLPHVPLERIVLETDAPYLAPVPHRGQRNESAFLAETLRAVADIYKVEPCEVEKCTNDTVKRIFIHMKWT